MTDRQQLKQQVFMSVACQISLLGTCPRKAVGAVLVREGRCISWGFNGAPPGTVHCEENNHGIDAPPPDAQLTEVGLAAWYVSGCRNATHAEANALAFAAKQGISTDNSTLYVTVSPCDTCSRLLIASGIKAVYYLEEYRDARGLDLLSEAGVLIAQCAV